MSLPKKNKFSLKQVKDHFFQKSRRLYSPCLTLTYLLDSNLDEPKFVISISKKVAKLATKRNQIRRRLSALLISNSIHFSPGLYLFSPKDIQEENSNYLDQSLKEILSRLNK